MQGPEFRRGVSLGRRAGVFAGVVTLVATVFLGSASYASKPTFGAGCDTNRLAGSWHPGDARSRRANVITCLTYTHVGYGESWMIVTPSFRTHGGVVVPGAVMRGGSYQDNPTGNLPSLGVARSIDRGDHWANLQFGGNATEPFNRCGSDPGFYRDPITNRTLWYGDGSCVEVSYVAGAMNIAYSDDGGESWTDFADPMNFWPDIFDAAHMIGAPARLPADVARIRKSGYIGNDGRPGNVIYFCGGSTCYPSFDGGVTYDKARKSGVKALAAGQRDGLLYTLSGGRLQVSADEGATFHSQGAPIPSSLTPACTRAGGDGPLWLDKDNNVYVSGVNPAGRLAVTYSRNGGTTWAKPVIAQMPDVTKLGAAPAGEPMCSFMADPDRPGHVAFAYHGATSKTPAPVEHGYLATTYDLFDRGPLFTGGQVDSNDKPLMPAGGPTMAGGAGTPTHSVSRYDFMGVYISPIDGSPWGSFAWDRCAMMACADRLDPDVTSNGNTQRNAVWTGWVGAVGTVVSRPRA